MSTWLTISNTFLPLSPWKGNKKNTVDIICYTEEDLQKQTVDP